MVPGLAIQWDRQGAFVWRVTDKNTVERVDVAILARDCRPGARRRAAEGRRQGRLRRRRLAACPDRPFAPQGS